MRVGDQGPAVVLRRGCGKTGDIWAPLAAELVRGRTVVAPDLRGTGLSSRSPRAATIRGQGRDVARALGGLRIERADVVVHDMGDMVAYAFAAQRPDRVIRFVVMDTPVPGVGPWDEVLESPLL